MKKYFYILAAGLITLFSCEKKAAETPLTANFDIEPAVVNAGNPVKFTAKASGGSGSYTYQWTVKGEVLADNKAEVTYIFKTNGAEVVVLKVSDSNGASVEKKKTVVVNAAKIPETGTLTLNWAGRMEGYNSISSPAIADDGSVYTSCRDNSLYKWSSSGQLLWKKAILTPSAGKSVSYGIPTIDTDGTIFICGGDKVDDNKTKGDATFKAFNPDGSVKWSFSQWYRADGSNPAPTVFGIMPAIDDDNVYFGCTGQNGITASVNKATGARNGFASTAGGVRSGVVLSKNGTVAWYGGEYGLFGVDKAVLDAGGNNKVNQSWRVFGEQPKKATKAMSSMQACLTVNGKPCIAGVSTDLIGTKVYVVDASTGEVVSECYIDDTDEQDQGGVVVTADGKVVVALNYTLGQDNGGIAIVDPATGSLVSRFRTQEKVSGSPAVDKAGNIHFGTESGYYYIVKPSGTDYDLLVKRDLSAIILDDNRYKETFNGLGTSKIWCSPTIGDDGKIYICFTDDDTHDLPVTFGGVVCLSHEDCKGPADSEWPMLGRDRRHTAKQL